MILLILISVWFAITAFIPFFFHCAKVGQRKADEADRLAAEAEYAEFLRRKG